MGSCNKKLQVINGAVSRISVTSLDQEKLFTKPAEDLTQSSKMQIVPSLPRRSSQLLPSDLGLRRDSNDISASPVPMQRRGSFNQLPKRGSLSENVPKSESDLGLIKSALSKHFIFSSLTDVQINAITQEMRLFVFPTQTIIFEQNSSGDNFFIITKGKVEVVINLKVAAILNPGDSFGEVALLHDTPRTATIITLQESFLWGLDRSTFRGILQNLSSQKYSENLVFIENIRMFQSLTKKQKESLANAMISELYKAGSRIVTEGERGDFMFIIREGSVVVTQKGVEIRKLAKNDYFGEQALLNNNLRTATITALENVACLSISSEGLYSALGNHLQEIIHLNTIRMAFDASPLLSRLTASQINDIISVIKIKKMKRGAVLIAAGSRMDCLWIVLSGCIGTKIAKIKALQTLGAEEVMHGSKTVLESFAAIEDSDIGEIPKSVFEEKIGGRLAEVIEKNEVLKIIKDIGIFRGVDGKTLEKIVRMVSVVKFRHHEVIVSQNSKGDSFFLIKSGTVEVIKNGSFLRNISKFDYFGERSLIFNKNRSATVRAAGDVECWTLTKSQFNTVVDDNLRQQLLDRIELQDDKIEMDDLLIIEQLYKGPTSHFYICMNSKNSKLYVLKTMLRNTIIYNNLQQPVVTEKKILSQIDHSFIIRLVKTFKDSKRLCMLMEYVRGIDLKTALNMLKKPDELDYRFYAGVLLLILHYLHDHEIIYRNMCLKNFIIDLQGYPKLIDFNCSKYLQGRTYTLIGNPHYIAPEVITGHGYNFTADYWSLGVVLYEMMYGLLPFANKENDPVLIYQTIINHRLVFPSNVNPLSKSRDFISILLAKSPTQRSSFEKLKTHPWFVGLNWELLINKQIKAPLLPVAKDLSAAIHQSVKQKLVAENVLNQIETNDDLVIPRFNVNSRWDADF